MKAKAIAFNASIALGLVAVIFAAALLSPKAWAHALAPSLLTLEALDPGRYQISWKTPLQRVDGGQLQPVFPESCKPLSQPSLAVAGTALSQGWILDCGETGLTGQTVGVAGIEASRADVLLRITLPNGATLQQILTSDNSHYVVPAEQAWHSVFMQYLVLGFEHLLVGLDHVLFVLALTLLVGFNRKLIWTVTSFTLGHSATLAAAVLGYVRFPQTLAEILIALSILVTFAGVVNRKAGSLMQRQAPVLGFAFGLLHGLGFAGALAEVGLPHSGIPTALLAFNIGIELGQLLLIVFLLAVSKVFGARAVDFGWRLGWIPLYAAGSLGGFWFWQRLLAGF